MFFLKHLLRGRKEEISSYEVTSLEHRQISEICEFLFILYNPLHFYYTEKIICEEENTESTLKRTFDIHWFRIGRGLNPSPDVSFIGYQEVWKSIRLCHVKVSEGPLIKLTPSQITGLGFL